MTDNLERTQSIAHSESVPTLAPGDIAAENYVVKSVLGRGGMSVVYLVEQNLLTKDFALKVLDVHKQTDIAIRRFQQEAKTASLLKHPNLVTVHDYGLLRHDQPYLVMDYISGPTLAQVLKTRGAMPVSDVVALTSQIAFALMYAHERGIVHRDIKPGNIMLLNPKERAQEGTVKIVDFGIAKLTQSEDGDSQGLTKTGEIFGSPIYMSPEQCKSGNVDQRSDIYSLGCVVFECLTGSPPFVGDSAMSTMVMRLTQDPKSLKEATSGFEFSPILESIVKKMLMVDPADRYQDAESLVSDLMQLQHGDNKRIVKAIRQKKQEVKIEKKERMSPVVRRTALVAGTAVLACAATFCFDRFNYHPDVAPPAVSDKLQNIESDLTTVFVPPVCTPIPGGFSVKFHSDCGKFTVAGGAEVPAANIAIPVKDGKLVSIDLSEIAGANLKTMQALAPLSFQLVKFGNRYMATNTSIRALKGVHKINDLDLEGCDNVTSLEGVYKLDLLSLKTMNTRIPSTEIMKIENLGHLKSLGFGPDHAPDAVLELMKKNPGLVDLAYHGPLLVDNAPSGRGLDIKDIEIIAGMPQLESLFIWSSPMVNRECLIEISKLKNLKRLLLMDCDITPDAIPILKQMQSLRHLELTNKGWSKKDQYTLREAMKGRVKELVFNEPVLEHKKHQRQKDLKSYKKLEMEDIYSQGELK